MRVAAIFVGLVALVLSLVGVKAGQILMLVGFGKKMAAEGPPPEVVATRRAEKEAWESTLSSIGTVTAAREVLVTTEAPGAVVRILFESGASVVPGQPLVELDVSVERAQLASARARRTLTASVLERTRALVAKGAISKSELESDEAEFSAAESDVAALEAQIERKVVRAPFGGRLGIRNVNLGQYLSPGDVVAVLESTRELFVDFALPQQRLEEVAVGMPVRVESGDVPAAPRWARIVAISPAIDATTRSLELRARLETQNGPAESRPSPREGAIGDAGAIELHPGMFVNVAVVLPSREPLVVVPATAIVRASYGDSVFLVEAPDGGARQAPDGGPILEARQQFVRTGPERGDFVAVTEGVTAGERVVVAGAFKLRNGAPVLVDDAMQPEPRKNPRPPNR